MLSFHLLLVICFFLSPSIGSHLCKFCFPLSLPSPSISEFQITKKKGIYWGKDPEYFTLYLGPPKFFNMNANSLVNVEKLTIFKAPRVIILYCCPLSNYLISLSPQPCQGYFHPILEMWKSRLKKLTILTSHYTEYSASKPRCLWTLFFSV